LQDFECSINDIVLDLDRIIKLFIGTFTISTNDVVPLQNLSSLWIVLEVKFSKQTLGRNIYGFFDGMIN
jgi:hypothetical protein